MVVVGRLWAEQLKLLLFFKIILLEQMITLRKEPTLTICSCLEPVPIQNWVFGASPVSTPVIKEHTLRMLHVGLNDVLLLRQQI